jgi:hypothetical protein
VETLLSLIPSILILVFTWLPPRAGLPDVALPTFLCRNTPHHPVGSQVFQHPAGRIGRQTERNGNLLRRGLKAVLRALVAEVFIRCPSFRRHGVHGDPGHHAERYLALDPEHVQTREQAFSVRPRRAVPSTPYTVSISRLWRSRATAPRSRTTSLIIRNCLGCAGRFVETELVDLAGQRNRSSIQGFDEC